MSNITYNKISDELIKKIELDRKNHTEKNIPMVQIDVESGKIVNVNNFTYIDLDIYRKQVDIETKKRNLGLTARYNIITVGRIIPQKNPIFIAKSFVELCKLRDDCNFVWVGDGNLRTESERIFKQNGVQSRVHFLGQRADVNEILQCCNLFFMPSSFEGLGIVIIEAQAAGLPCLVSR